MELYTYCNFRICMHWSIFQEVDVSRPLFWGASVVHINCIKIITQDKKNMKKKMDQKRLVLTLTFDNFFVDFPWRIQI